MMNDIETIRKALEMARQFQRQLSGPKWIGTVAGEANLLDAAEAALKRLEVPQ